MPNLLVWLVFGCCAQSWTFVFKRVDAVFMTFLTASVSLAGFQDIERVTTLTFSFKGFVMTPLGILTFLGTNATPWAHPTNEIWALTERASCTIRGEKLFFLHAAMMASKYVGVIDRGHITKSSFTRSVSDIAFFSLKWWSLGTATTNWSCINAFEDINGNRFMAIVKKVTTDGKLALLQNDDKIHHYEVEEIKMLF